MVCSRIENFGEIPFLAGNSTLQAYRGPLLDPLCDRRLRSGNYHRLRELAGQHNVK